MMILMRMASVSVLFTIVMVKCHDQRHLGRKCFSLYFHITVHQRKSGQELKQCRKVESGVDVDVMEGCCLLDCFP